MLGRLYVVAIFCLLFPYFSFAQSGTAARYSAPLEEALFQYQQIAKIGGWEKFPDGKKIKENQQDSRIPIVRRILAATGDYKDEAHIISCGR